MPSSALIKIKYRFILLTNSFVLFISTYAQIAKAPLIKEGDGPFPKLILRGGVLINGTGTPAYGPVDIVIESNRIISITIVGFPGSKIDSARRPKLKEGGKELDIEGKYVLPGLIDMHGHIGGTEQG